MDESKMLNNYIKTDINNNTEGERSEVELQLGINELQQRVAERTKALEKQCAQLNELKSIISRSGLLVFTWRIESDKWPVEFVSENVADVLGYSVDDFISGRVSWPGITHQDDVSRLEKEVAGYLEQGVKRWSQEYRLLTKSGEIIWCCDGNIALADSAGRITRIQAVIYDITERKRLDDKYRTIIDTSIDGFWLISMQGNIIEVNDAYCKMSGYSREELLKIKLFDIEVSEKPEDVQAHLCKVKEFGGDRFETRHKCKDGSIIDIMVSVTYLRNLDQMFVFIRDITERKKTEEALTFSNIILRTQQESSIDGILVVDEKGKILSFNQRFVDLWSIPLEVIEAKSDERALWSVMDKLATPEEFARKVKYLYEARDEICRDAVALKDGRTFDRYSAPMFGVGKKYYGRVWYFRDITERKKVEDELRSSEARLKDLLDKTTRSQEELRSSYTELKMSKDDLVRSEKLAYTGRIAASIAHEIRNPLTNVSMSLRQLKKGGRIKPDGLKHSEIIERNVERINFLITELLNCARPAKFNPQPCDMHQVIEDALIADKGKIKLQKVKVVKFLSAKPSILKIDKEHMGRVLLNLISNAVDAMPGGGNLTINTEINNDLFLIKIQDSGKGIPEKDIIRIFDPFFSTKPQGVGLGLTTCYGIIVSHGGTIEVESKWRKGTAFVISLPIASAQRERERERESKIAGESLW